MGVAFGSKKIGGLVIGGKKVGGLAIGSKKVYRSTKFYCIRGEPGGTSELLVIDVNSPSSGSSLIGSLPHKARGLTSYGGDLYAFTGLSSGVGVYRLDLNNISNPAHLGDLSLGLNLSTSGGAGISATTYSGEILVWTGIVNHYGLGHINISPSLSWTWQEHDPRRLNSLETHDGLLYGAPVSKLVTLVPTTGGSWSQTSTSTHTFSYLQGLGSFRGELYAIDSNAQLINLSLSDLSQSTTMGTLPRPNDNYQFMDLAAG